MRYKVISMENKYLDSYLLYQKENNMTNWKKLVRLPWYVLITFLASLDLIILPIVFDGLISNKILIIILYFCGLIFLNISVLLCDNHMIATSQSTLEKYAESWVCLNGWLKSVHIANDEDKKLLLSRLKEHIESHEAKQKETTDRWDKWLQILVIPAVLALITTIIANQKEVDLIIASVLTIMLSFGAIYGVIIMIRSAGRLFTNRRINQMRCFANDLQSTMDMKQLGWIDTSIN